MEGGREGGEREMRGARGERKNARGRRKYNNMQCGKKVCKLHEAEEKLRGKEGGEESMSQQRDSSKYTE